MFLTFKSLTEWKAFEMSELIKCCSYIDMLTALPDATNNLTLPCHEQRAGAATVYFEPQVYWTINDGPLRFDIKKFWCMHQKRNPRNNSALCFTCVLFMASILHCIELQLENRCIFSFTKWIYCIYCIVSIHLYSASCSAHQSEALPVWDTQREESSLERAKRGTLLTS